VEWIQLTNVKGVLQTEASALLAARVVEVLAQVGKGVAAAVGGCLGVTLVACVMGRLGSCGGCGGDSSGRGGHGNRERKGDKGGNPLPPHTATIACLGQHPSNPMGLPLGGSDGK
jgi:hypothetical protein